MKRSIIHGILILTVVFCLMPSGMAHTLGSVYLKDGTPINGTIVGLIPGEPITLRGIDGRLYEFPDEDVDRIEVTKASEDPDKIRFIFKKRRKRGS
jgi:hypothetical protein